jgi:hypothetical protein
VPLVAVRREIGWHRLGLIVFGRREFGLPTGRGFCLDCPRLKASLNLNT